MYFRNSATALYSSGVRFGAVMVHRLAPPMIEFIGVLMISGSYGRYASAQSNFADFTRLPRDEDDPNEIAASPETISGSGGVSRPVYLKLPFLDISSRRSMCLTWVLLLNTSSASNPSKPSSLV